MPFTADKVTAAASLMQQGMALAGAVSGHWGVPVVGIVSRRLTFACNDFELALSEDVPQLSIHDQLIPLS